MPRTLSLPTLACLTRQGAEPLVSRLRVAESFRVHRIWVNLTEGKMLLEVEAESRDAIQGWFDRERFHFDWLCRVELEAQEGKLAVAE